MNVRYYTVARDEYEGGSCPICARCGANMRHVTVIDGRTYGSGCGKIVIEEARRAESGRKQLVAEASQQIASAYVNFERWSVDYIQARVVSCQTAGKPELARAWSLLLRAKGAA